jgi:hypothetical protein
MIFDAFSSEAANINFVALTAEKGQQSVIEAKGVRHEKQDDSQLPSGGRLKCKRPGV